MLGTVESYIVNSQYFTIELKNKFNAYDIQPEEEDKPTAKMNWKHFFGDSFAE